MRKTIGSTWMQPVGSANPVKKTDGPDLWIHKCPSKGATIFTVRGMQCSWCCEHEKTGLRQAGSEVVRLLMSSARRMNWKQIAEALPHVPSGTLRRRLTEMSSAGNLERCREHGKYEYGLSATMVTT